MINECTKAESGKHEPDYEHLDYETAMGSDAARFGTTCLHCGVGAEIVIYDHDFHWQEKEE